MLKKLSLILGLVALLAGPALAGPVTIGDVQRLNLSQLTLNGHTLTAAEFNVLDGVTPGTVLASSAVVVDSSKNITSFNNVGLAGTITNTRAPTADSAATDNGSVINLTAPVDTTGTNTHNGWLMNLTVGNATGGTNTVNGWKFANYTGDAQVDVNAINIGTSDALGTATAVKVGSGWDFGLNVASPAIISSTLGVSGVFSSGLSGTAGEIDVFPGTASNGIFKLLAVNNSGAFNSTISNSNIGQATVYSLPDPGAATANFVLDAGTQTVAGVKSFSGTLNAGLAAGGAGIFNVYPTTTANGILKLAAINNTGNFNSTISNMNSGQATVYSLPDCGAATCNFLTDAGTQTIAGAKTFSSVTSITPTAIIGPPVTAGGSSLTITAAKAGQIFKLDTAAGTTFTLPAATGTGNHYFFVVTTTATSNAHKILCASGSDNIIGFATGQNAATAKVFVATVAGTFHSIQMPFAGTQPSGGFQGDTFEFIDTATNVWTVRGMYTAGTTPTTPFSTATS